MTARCFTVTVPRLLLQPLADACARELELACSELLIAEFTLDADASHPLDLLIAHANLLRRFHTDEYGDGVTFSLDPGTGATLLAHAIEVSAAGTGASGEKSLSGLRGAMLSELIGALERGLAADTSGDDGARRAGRATLTPREREVFELLSQGHSYAQIALELVIDLETVRSHARRVRRKLGLASSRELAEDRQAPGPQRH
jgi:DNA-binding CsgD family transcriptional regulator